MEEIRGTMSFTDLSLIKDPPLSRTRIDFLEVGQWETWERKKNTPKKFYISVRGNKQRNTKVPFIAVQKETGAP